MTRDELIEAGRRSLPDMIQILGTDDLGTILTGYIVDTIEPLIRADERADLRAEVQVMKDEAGQALLHAETTDEVTAASVGISVLDDMLALFDGSE